MNLTDKTKKSAKPTPIEQRNKEIIALRGSGATLADIGEKYGLTKARVLQIVGKKTSFKRHITAQQIQMLVAAFFAENGTYPSLRFLADMADVSTSYARLLLDELGEKGTVKLAVVRGRVYIKGVVPPSDLPEEVRRKAIDQLKSQEKEWTKK